MLNYRLGTVNEKHWRFKPVMYRMYNISVLLEPLRGLGKLVLIPVRGSPLGSKCSV